MGLSRSRFVLIQSALLFWFPGIALSAGMKSTLHLNVTDPNVEILLDGDPTKQKGLNRVFVTPELIPGHLYQYEVTIRLAGRRSYRQTLTFRGGENVRLDVPPLLSVQPPSLSAPVTQPLSKTRAARGTSISFGLDPVQVTGGGFLHGSVAASLGAVSVPPTNGGEEKRTALDDLMTLITMRGTGTAHPDEREWNKRVDKITDEVEAAFLSGSEKMRTADAICKSVTGNGLRSLVGAQFLSAAARNLPTDAATFESEIKKTNATLKLLRILNPGDFATVLENSLGPSGISEAKLSGVNSVEMAKRLGSQGDLSFGLLAGQNAALLGQNNLAPILTAGRSKFEAERGTTGPYFIVAKDSELYRSMMQDFKGTATEGIPGLDCGGRGQQAVTSLNEQQTKSLLKKHLNGKVMASEIDRLPPADILLLKWVMAKYGPGVQFEQDYKHTMNLETAIADRLSSDQPDPEEPPFADFAVADSEALRAMIQSRPGFFLNNFVIIKPAETLTIPPPAIVGNAGSNSRNKLLARKLLGAGKGEDYTRAMGAMRSTYGIGAFSTPPANYAKLVKEFERQAPKTGTDGVDCFKSPAECCAPSVAGETLPNDMKKHAGALRPNHAEAP